jgi:hypothetical protein
MWNPWINGVPVPLSGLVGDICEIRENAFYR